MKTIVIPPTTSVSDANGNSKVTTIGVGGVLSKLIINVTNAANSLVELSDSSDPANSKTAVVAAAVTANGSFSLDFGCAQSKGADWRVGTNAGVTVIAVTEG